MGMGLVTSTRDTGDPDGIHERSRTMTCLQHNSENYSLNHDHAVRHRLNSLSAAQELQPLGGYASKTPTVTSPPHGMTTTIARQKWIANYALTNQSIWIR